MALVNETAQWKALEAHWKQMSAVRMSDLFAADPGRALHLRLLGGLFGERRGSEQEQARCQQAREGADGVITAQYDDAAALMTALTGMASGFLSLVLLRLLFGVPLAVRPQAGLSLRFFAAWLAIAKPL